MMKLDISKEIYCLKYKLVILQQVDFKNFNSYLYQFNLFIELEKKKN